MATFNVEGTFFWLILEAPLLCHFLNSSSTPSTPNSKDAITHFKEESQSFKMNSKDYSSWEFELFV